MLLGIDIGTTAAKLLLTDDQQGILAAASITYEVDKRIPSISEIDPDVWCRAVVDGVARLRQQAPHAIGQVQSIGLSGQMHSIVLLDECHKPVRPAILWNDTRGGPEARALRNTVPGIAELTGIEPMASFSAAKLAWLQSFEPDAFALARHLLWPKDYVRLWLTGELVTDVSDAAGSQLFDQKRRAWSDEVLSALGLDRSLLPRLMESPEVSGRLRPSAASELGLPVQTPVAAGGADAATSALGLGCLDEGDAFISLGTGAVFLTALEAYRPRPDTLLHTFAHAALGRWYRMAAMLNGASCLAWAARLCGQLDLPTLLEHVEARGPGPGRILFQPYLRGERTPHNDERARGALIGLDAASDGIDVTRAVLEGVAFSLRQAQDLLCEDGTRLDEVYLVGGGARSAFWCRVIATVLDRPLHVVEDADYAAARGATLLAAAALQGPGASPTRFKPTVSSIIEPDESRVSSYRLAYDQYVEMYPAIQGLSPNR